MSTNLIYATICIAHHPLSFHGPLNPVPLIGVPYKRVNVNMKYPMITIIFGMTEHKSYHF